MTDLVGTIFKCERSSQKPWVFWCSPPSDTIEKPKLGWSYFGFHDLRRGFATYNADRMTADALQALMQHKDYHTTQQYINLARQLKPAVADIFVPTALKDGKKA